MLNNANTGMTAEHWLLKAVQAEAAGELLEAVSFYKRAYRLNPELVSLLLYEYIIILDVGRNLRNYQ